jgi:hypothetical protein
MFLRFYILNNIDSFSWINVEQAKRNKEGKKRKASELSGGKGEFVELSDVLRAVNIV